MDVQAEVQDRLELTSLPIGVIDSTHAPEICEHPFILSFYCMVDKYRVHNSYCNFKHPRRILAPVWKEYRLAVIGKEG